MKNKIIKASLIILSAVTLVALYSVLVYFLNNNNVSKELFDFHKRLSSINSLKIYLSNIDNEIWQYNTIRNHDSKKEITLYIEHFDDLLVDTVIHKNPDEDSRIKKNWYTLRNQINRFIAKPDAVISNAYYKQNFEKPIADLLNDLASQIEILQDDIYLRGDDLEELLAKFLTASFAVSLILILVIFFSWRFFYLTNQKIMRKIGDINEISLDGSVDQKPKELVSQMGLFEIISEVKSPMLISIPSKKLIIANQSAQFHFSLKGVAGVFHEEQLPNEISIVIKYISENNEQEFSINGHGYLAKLRLISDDAQVIFFKSKESESQESISIIKVQKFIEDLLVPISKLHMALHVMLEGSLGDLNARQESILFESRKECFKIRKTITNFQENDSEKILDDQKFEKVFLPDVLEEALGSVKLIADLKEIEFIIDFPPLIDQVLINRKQILVLITNLIDNAIHHSKKAGKIQIRIKESKDNVSFWIQNYGANIPKEYQKRIFDKYFQLPNENEKRDGLGLYIAKQIIDLHKGTIGVRSSETIGTTFWFKIPKK